MNQNTTLNQTRRTGKLLNFLVLFCLIISTVVSTPVAQAQAPQPTPTNTDTPTVSPTQTETTTPISETVTPSVVTTPAPVTPTETPIPVATLMPVVNDQAAVPALALSTKPEFITPGGNLKLEWVIEGLTVVEGQFVLEIILPDGVSVKKIKGSEYDPTTRVLTISVTDASGQVHLDAGVISSDMLITAALLENKEIVAEAKLLVPMREQFKQDQTGGVIEARNGGIKVEFPTDALPEEATITIGKPAREALPNGALLGVPFEITAYGDMSKQELKKFSKELTLTVSYADLGIPPEREGDLHVYWYNETTKEWEALPTWVDKKTKTLQALTDHFTVFDLNVSNWQSNHLPTVDAFQVSGFTGAGTYSLPIQLPAGPGGFQPSLALTYNSQVVDQSTLNTQASWVGMGWSLDSSYIELDTHGTGSWDLDDTYLLQVGGISTRIVLDGAGTYRATDENFWKITKASNTWIVQDKQGITYYFEYVSSYPYETQAAPNCSGYDFAGYRWSLTRVRNIFNQEIQYTYATQTKGMYVEQYITSTGACYLDTIYPITATYPETIVYANGRYRVRFDKGSSPNRLDYQAAWDGPGEFNAYEKYRLQNIYVEQDADGNNVFETILRRYQFTYKANTDSDIIYPSYTWSAGGKTTTLKAVQEFGVGGTASLPATTFTYGDNLHLTRVDNGYGGAVEFTYGRWYGATNARKSYTVEQQFGQPSYPCRIDDWQPWTALYGEMNCGDGSRDPLHIWGTHGMGIAYDFYNASYSVYGVNHSKDLIRPGGVYKLSTNVNWQPGMSVQVGVFDGIRFQLFYVNTSSNTNIISLPVDAYLAQVVIDETGGSGIGNNHPAPATVSYLKLELLPSIYRVTQKKVYKSPSDQSPYTYSYDYSKAGVDSAAFNDGVIAPASTCDPSTPSASCFEFFQRYSEFRGHAQVTETGPDGRQTITEYFQDDLLKGRPKSVTSTDGAKTITKATYAYTSTPLSLGNYTSCNGCPAFLGLGRNWIYTNAVENRNYDLNGNYQTTRTAYAYDAGNGNLISQTEQVWNGSSWSNYRTTETTYYPNTGAAYLVGLPARIRSLDSIGNVLASTLMFYDGNVVDYTIPPTVGKLTATRTRVSVDGQQWNQVDYGYDAWGNKTSVTTYTGYGTASAAPTTVGQKTYVCYGSDPSVMGDELLGGIECTGSSFHNFPLWTKNPLGHQTIYTYDYGLGVPLSETDPNGSVTRAEYDLFGRIVKLIRPGDDSVSPTISITYPSTNPFTFPFTTTITQKIKANQTYSVQRVYDGMGRQTRISSDGINVDTVYVSATQTKQSLPYANGETVYYTTTTLNPTARTTTVTATDTTSTTTASNGLVTTTTDARGNQTVTASDVWGRIVAVTPPTGPAVAYAYDEMNRLISAVRGSNAVPPVGTNPGTTNLVSWWSMNEAMGVRSDSYSTNPLTENNAVTASAGKQDNAATFVTASSEYLSIPDNATISMGAGQRLSMCTWVKLTSTSARGNLVAKGGADGNYSYILRYLETINRFNFIATNTGSSAQFVGVSADAFGAVAVGTWNFVCSGYDGSNLWIQVNAGARNTVPMAGDIFNDSGNLNLGALNNIYGFLGGNLDETLIYKRNLSATEITWLYNNGNGRAYASLTDPASPGTTGLVSWWGLNETGGTRYDSYGANHLTDINTVSATAKQGNAASFVTANQKYLSAADNANLSGGDIDFTLVAHVYLNNLNDHQIILEKGSDIIGWDYRLLYNKDVNSLRFRVMANGVSGFVDSAPVQPNTWYTVVAWHDSVNNTVNMQVNNGAVVSAPYSGGSTNTANPLTFGAVAGGPYALDGRIDEVALYKRVLTATERAWFYNNGSGRAYANLTDPASPGTTSLMAWWGLNETGGTRYDSYGANHLTDVNTVEATAKQGNAATFVSANSKYLSAGDNASLSMNGTNFTIAGWVKFTTAGAENQVVVGKQGSGSLNEYQIYKNTSNKLVFAVYGNTSGSIGASATTTNSVTAGWWYFFTAVYDGSNVKISLNAANFDSVPYSSGAVDNTNSFRIGANAGGNYLNGSVDEVVIYKRALSQAEVYWLFNNGKGRNYADLTVPPPVSTTTTTLTYDHAGRKLTMTDPDMGKWSYGYDALGNLTSQTDARLCTLTLTYDALSRLSTKSSNNDTDCVTQVNTTYTYDVGANAKGLRTSMTSGTVSNAWTYDIRGRLLSETVNAGTAYTTNWTYNSADMPITMTYPDNETVNYNYNSRMLLESVIGAGTYVASTTYDSAGRIDLRTFGNTTKTDYDYYPWTAQGGRLQYLKSGTTSNPTSLQNLTYTYDAGGNIQTLTEATNSGQKQCFQYDVLDRLTNATTYTDVGQGCTTQLGAGNYDETYTYDPASGNLASKGSSSNSYTYNPPVTCAAGTRNIPHAVYTAFGNTYGYDCNGNQTTRLLQSGLDIGTYDLKYDAENRLVEVKRNSSVIAQFTFDGDGNRVKSTVSGTTTYFVGGHYEVTGSTVTKYYFAGASRVAMRKYTVPSSMTVEYLLGDHLGSTSLTTDKNGVKTSEMRYKPWGEVRSWWTSALATTPAYELADYTFTGQYSYMDDLSTPATEGFGLMFYNARFYDPALGRFTSADTIIPGGVQGLDRYAYANNSPIMYIDPSGHITLCGASCEAEYEKPQYSLDDVAGIYGITFNPGWSATNKATVLLGIFNIAQKFKNESNSSSDAAYQSCIENMAGPTSTCSQSAPITAVEAFKNVFSAGIDFIWGCSNCSRMAWAKSENKIAFRAFYGSWYSSSLLRNINLVVHELGHVFDYLNSWKSDRSGKTHGPSRALPWNLTNDRNGFGDMFIDQQSDTISSGEIFADMFLGWVQGGWATKNGVLTTDASQRVDWLNQNMSGYMP